MPNGFKSFNPRPERRQTVIILVNSWTEGVNSEGRRTPGWEEQADLLEREGVTMKDAWHVDLKKHQWNV